MVAKSKKIWRKNFEVKQTHFQMATPALYDMMNLQHITLQKRILKEAIWVQEGYDNTATYFIREELRELIEKTIDAILKYPAKIDAIHRKTTEYNTKFFNYAKTISKLNLKKLTNKQIAEIWEKWTNLVVYSHGYALPTTWFVDSDGEDLSKLLIKKIEHIIKEKKSALTVPEVFNHLTTPLKPSFVAIEENESLGILRLIMSDKNAQKVFLQDNVKKIISDLSKIDSKVEDKIIKHFKKWRWAPYTYVGPAYDLDHYIEIWSSLLKQKINVEKQIKEGKEHFIIAKRKKAEIIKVLEIDKKTLHLFDIATDIIFLKSYRKDCWFYGCYVAEDLYKEIGRRLGLSLRQVWFMAWWEIVPALRENKFNPEIINKRMKLGVLYQKGEKGVIYTGEKAKKFLQKLNIEKEKAVKLGGDVFGTCACPGQTMGTVKIVNLPEEMGKMNKGDIMVAHTTFPSLVPAMKKASAIVTDDGGITCHAAIVARELKIPCVVGTKIATKALKDGDLVEVDAERGIIKKIK
jgi:phosphohistidine swiveling domain-containing protein